MLLDLPEAEPRLQKRYRRLVMEHLAPAQRVAAGLRAEPSLSSAFAATQAAWRFYANPSVQLPQWAGPLIDCAQAGVRAACDSWVPVVIDWSPLHLGRHASRADRVPLAHGKDLGYDLLTALALSDRDGSPIAPVCLELRAADGVHSTPSVRPGKPPSLLDGVEPVMRHVHKLLSEPVGRAALQPVFIIDRGADSVGHFRAWSRQSWHWLVRANEGRLVLHEGRERHLSEVADRLHRQRKAFVDTRAVLFQGKLARQFVAETTVVLHRPARTHRVQREATAKAAKEARYRHVNVPGTPLAVRLIVSELRDPRGKVLARWLLLTNLPAGEVSAATAALWYYWRWRIESYHKLLKGAGQHIECWQQETARAMTRRLCIAAMAAVVVWHLARDRRPQAKPLRQLLVRLSGRQIRRSGPAARAYTEPALLAGLGVLVPMLHLLEQMTPKQIRAMVRKVLPELVPSETG